MTAEGCREWRERLGAYVLGHLTEDERAATSAHIEGCAACRAEAESLAPLAELLPIADPARLTTAPAPPAELADRIAVRIAREGRVKRRRRRLAIGLSGATAAAATATVLLAIVLSSPGTGASAQRVSFGSLPDGVAIGATLQPRPFGTEIRMNVHGIRSGTLCRVFLRRTDGTRMPAGSFRYRYGGTEQAVLTSALDLSAARAVGVRAGNRTFVAPLRPSVGAEATSNRTTTDKEYS
ncbi:MAG: zf-HC2 domain-containing protein [Actinomycetota bacterium]